MVYRNLSLEDAEQKYKEITATMPPVAQDTPPVVPEKVIPSTKRKRVKPVARKSK